MYGASKHRLDRLEKRHKDAGWRCPQCGSSSDPRSPTEFEVEWVEWVDSPPFDEAPIDEWCPECGKQMTIVVTWLEDRDPDAAA
jgi:predicted RNA-binding Zn-ribbon protein involved in translation (DUF1610 family)